MASTNAKTTAHPSILHPTKIHKPKPVGRPIISGCEGPTERISSFVDSVLQPVTKVQKSYLKDTTEFINFIEGTKVPENIFLVSMDITSLYTNIPQEEGITIVCNAYEVFHENNPPIPTALLKEIISYLKKLISFQLNLMEETLFKHMEPQWAQKWQLLLPIFSCPL